jgi:hypothetical protein
MSATALQSPSTPTKTGKHWADSSGRRTLIAEVLRGKSGGLDDDGDRASGDA